MVIRSDRSDISSYTDSSFNIANLLDSRQSSQSRMLRISYRALHANVSGNPDILKNR